MRRNLQSRLLLVTRMMMLLCMMVSGAQLSLHSSEEVVLEKSPEFQWSQKLIRWPIIIIECWFRACWRRIGILNMAKAKNQRNRHFGGLQSDFHIWAFWVKSPILATFCHILANNYHRMLVEGSLEAYCFTEYTPIKRIHKFSIFRGLGLNYHIWAFQAKSPIFVTFCHILVNNYHK